MTNFQVKHKTDIAILEWRNKAYQEAVDKTFKVISKNIQGLSEKTDLSGQLTFSYWDPTIGNVSFTLEKHWWPFSITHYYMRVVQHKIELTYPEFKAFNDLFIKAQQERRAEEANRSNKHITDYIGWTKPEPVKTYADDKTTVTYDPTKMKPVKVKRGDVTMVHTPTVTFTAVPSMMHGSWWANGPSYSVSNTSPLFENKKTVFKVSTEKTKRKRKTKKKTK
jgi:hypothetical protein